VPSLLAVAASVMMSAVGGRGEGQVERVDAQDHGRGRHVLAEEDRRQTELNLRHGQAP
jgi:hypothetical protein